MKKINLIISLTLLLTLLFIIPANALLNSDTTQINEFMEADMYPQAIALLEKRISDKPSDIEAHYRLGLCHLNTGIFSEADDRFAKTVKLEPGYGNKISAEYKRVGDEALQNGGTNEALNLYQTAIKYQPDLMNRIAQDVFRQGEAFIDQNHYKSADSTFYVATTFDISLTEQASDIFFNLGNSVEDSGCIDYYRTAKKYSHSHNQEIGQRLVQLSKDPDISEADKIKYKHEAGMYLSDAEMSEAFQPEYELLETGKYELLEVGKYKVVFLPDGLPSKNYFRIPMDVSSFEVSWNNYNTHFMLKTRSGRIITFEEIQKGKFFMIEKDFMVIPTTNKPLNISIKTTGI